VRGGALGAAGSVVGVLIAALGKGGFRSVDWEQMAVTFVTFFLLYLVKNGVFEPAKVITTAPSNEKAEAIVDDVKKAV